MIRQEVFNEIIGRDGQLLRNNAAELINLYVVYRMANAMSQRGVNPKVKIDGQVEFVLNNLHVDNGRYVVDFVDMRKQDRWAGAEIIFNNGLRIWARNTWVDPVAPAESVDESSPQRHEFQYATRHRDLSARDVMNQTDEYLTSSFYDQALSEVLTLVSEARKIGQRPANGELTDGIIYHMGEDHRLYAAYELVQYCKPAITDPTQEPKDIIVCHVISGSTEFGFSGHFGTEQQWIETVGSRQGRKGRPVEQVELTPFERGYLDYFREHKESAKDNSVERDRRHYHNTF